MVRQMSVCRIFVTDGPANAAHLADAGELCFPNIIASEALLGGFAEHGTFAWVTCAAAALQVVEVILVKHLAVVLKTEAAIQLRVLGKLFLIHPGPADEL